MAESEFEGWAVLELMGHRRLGGFVRQAEMFGAALCRVDVPGPEPGSVAATQYYGGSAIYCLTQYYGGSAIYCLTPTTEAMARAVALRNQPAPVQRWELPAPKEESGDWRPRCKGCGVEIEVGTGNVCEACAEEADGGDYESTLDDPAVDDNGDGLI